MVSNDGRAASIYPQQPREMGAICSTERNDEPSAAQHGEAAAAELQQATIRPGELPTRPDTVALWFHLRTANCGTDVSHALEMSMKTFWDLSPSTARTYAGCPTVQLTSAHSNCSYPSLFSRNSGCVEVQPTSQVGLYSPLVAVRV